MSDGRLIRSALVRSGNRWSICYLVHAVDMLCGVVAVSCVSRVMWTVSDAPYREHCILEVAAACSGYTDGYHIISRAFATPRGCHMMTAQQHNTQQGKKESRGRARSQKADVWHCPLHLQHLS